MNFKKFISILLCVSLLLSVAPLCVSAETETADSDEYIEGEIVIYSTKDVEDSYGYLQTASDSDTVYVDFDDVGIDAIEEVDTYSDDDNMYIAETDGDVKKICAELNKNGDIIAEPNYLYHTDSFEMPREITNNTYDYRYNQKWYMDDVLQVPQAWQDNKVTGNGVTIAIIDNGFDITGDDFPQNLWKNSKGTVGWNVCNSSDNIAPLRKSTGYLFNTSEHGSNVAGIIGMASNGSGGVGIAYGAQLMLIQAASYKNDSEEPMFSNAAVANAINFAVQNGADIISMSLGSSTYSLIIAMALSKANEAGVLAVAAAGNDGYSTDTAKEYPAALPTCIGVMAISESNTSKLTYFSNYDTSGGQYYEIAAPGDDILGCGVGGYCHMSGTSQATPIVAAVAALYMEKYPNRTIDQLKEDMLSTATDNVKPYVSTVSYTYKSLNAYAFLDSGVDEEEHTEHVWSEWTVSVKATCNAAGIRNRKCTICDETETEVIPKLTHEYETTVVAPTCTAKGYTQYKCKNCSNSYKTQSTAALGHSYSDWIISAYPTPQTDGTLVKECTRCYLISETKTLANVIRNCDVSENLLSGFTVATDVEKFISENTIATDAEITVTPTASGILGTDSIVTVKYTSGVEIDYTVVIFGDINGDGWYDGTDSVIVNCLANGMLTEDALTQAENMAADCNHDGVVDELDVSILNEAGVLATQIDQTKSPDELLDTSSAYNEYLGLIDQSFVETASTVNELESESPFIYLITFFKDIMEIIRAALLFVGKIK